MRPALHLLVGSVAAGNTILVGAAIGAYPIDAPRWLPHLPLEWAAFAACLAAYASCRIGKAAAAVAVLVPLAAVIEVYATPQHPV